MTTAEEWTWAAEVWSDIAKGTRKALPRVDTVEQYEQLCSAVLAYVDRMTGGQALVFATYLAVNLLAITTTEVDKSVHLGAMRQAVKGTSTETQPEDDDT